eukprot:scaffold43956_cov237-Amphora_coffeaeformis.AAC.2
MSRSTIFTMPSLLDSVTRARLNACSSMRIQKSSSRIHASMEKLSIWRNKEGCYVAYLKRSDCPMLCS